MVLIRIEDNDHHVWILLTLSISRAVILAVNTLKNGRFSRQRAHALPHKSILRIYNIGMDE